MTRVAFDRLMSIEGLDWTWGDQTIADYLRRQLAYDDQAQALHFDASHKMYHHRAFFDLLAALKDLDGVDEIEQVGETYDAWFESGRFFIRRGSWAYVGQGPMVDVGERPASARPIVGPPRASVEDVRAGDWNEAPRLVRAVARADSWLVVKWLDGEVSRCGSWCFDPLCAIWDEDGVRRTRIVDGGASVAWLAEDGSDAFSIRSRDLWALREDGQ